MSINTSQCQVKNFTTYVVEIDVNPLRAEGFQIGGNIASFIIYYMDCFGGWAETSNVNCALKVILIKYLFMDLFFKINMLKSFF